MGNFFHINIFISSVILKVLTYDYYPDFSTYYSPIKVFNLRIIFRRQRFFYPFVYPPPIYSFFLTLLAISIAQKLFLITSIVYLLSSIGLLFKLLTAPFHTLGFIFNRFVLNFFRKIYLGMGQIDNCCILMVTLIYIFYVKKGDFIRVFLLAVAIAL